MDFTALGNTPISNERPTGADARYDSGFQDLQTEIGKLSTPPGIVDWERVAELAASILETKSKDLQAASYLAVALIHTRKAEGVKIGLTIYEDLLTNFWDDLFPARKRGRSSAVEWWAERSDAALKHILPGISKVDRDALLERLNRIEDLLAEKLEEPPPLKLLLRTLKSLPLSEEGAPPPENGQKPEAGKAAPLESASLETASGPRSKSPESEKPDTAPEEAPPEQSAREDKGPKKEETNAPTAPPPRPETTNGPEGKSAPKIPAPLSNEAKEARKGIEAAYRQLHQTAMALQQAEPENPAAYRTNRISAWALITVPPRQSNGRSQIPPPQTGTAGRLRELRESGNWSGLLRGAEAELHRFVFWLDLNRFSHEALSRLNGEKGFENAQKAVQEETLSFMGRLWGLEKMAFADGTPFADEETRKWLDSLGGSLSDGAGAGFSAPARQVSPDAAWVNRAVEKGRALAEGNRLSDALVYFQEGIRSAASKEAELVWRISLADLLLEYGQPELATSHLERIMAEIEAHRLEIWDTELALAGLSAVWEGAAAGVLKMVDAAGILGRIAALDAAHALRLKTSR